MRMFVGIYVFVVRMRWIAGQHRRVTWIGCGLVDVVLFTRRPSGLRIKSAMTELEFNIDIGLGM